MSQQGASKWRLRSLFRRYPLGKVLELIKTHPVAFTFVILAVVVRITFWLYTNRVWEDAFITVTAARNVWAGNGLTHHSSEPRVQCFTSPIAVLIALAGEAFGQGILFIRFVSLLASVLTILYAYRIGQNLNFRGIAHVVLLSFLATDQLHVFFGMAGMETQLATALVMANVFYSLRQDWTKLGILSGLGLLTRPEFIFWIAIIFLVLIREGKQPLFVYLKSFVSVISPWLIFSTLYYGSPVPNTILAKNNPTFTGPWHRATVEEVWLYLQEWWEHIAPFKEFWFTLRAPLPDPVLKLIVALVVTLGLYGAWHASRIQNRIRYAAMFVGIFFLYRTRALLPTYFMWYLPPLTALLFLLGAYGLSNLRWKLDRLAPLLGVMIAMAYAIHIPFTYPLDRLVQQEIEIAVFQRTGQLVDQYMGQTDTAVLEPIGTIGLTALNKTIFDYPGLGSRIVVETRRQLEYDNLHGLIHVLEPSFIILRPKELRSLRESFPQTALNYQPVAHITAREDLILERWGLKYLASDTDFTILQRIDPPTELGPIR